MSHEQFERLVDSLKRPEAYTPVPSSVEMIQTHISVVFLEGSEAYKIKKPLNLGFLDFSTIERRRAACEDEVRLNRRLAPRVYKGVVPVTRENGRFRVEGRGETVEYAVRMERLPSDRTFEALLEVGSLDSGLVTKLALRVARFHREGECTPEIASQARFEVIAGNCRENFSQIRSSIGRTLTPELFRKLESATESALADLHDLIESRAARGIPRDTHGDLHLDHVYLLPGDGGDELVIIDCIEFNKRFRFADPVSDIAFVCMDLAFHDRRDLEKIAANAYFEASGDKEGRRLLAFYAAYRAIVRGKVEGMACEEPEVPQPQRESSLRNAQGHFLLAARYLASPSNRPGLILVAGLPGSGKSQLCRGLETTANMARLDSDQVRKSLAGVDPKQSAADTWGHGIYTPEWNDRTYRALQDQAREILLKGGRVAVEASFREESRRLPFVRMARRLRVPCLFIECQAEASEIRRRLAARTGDVSDADAKIYESAAKLWEPVGPEVQRARRIVRTEGIPEQSQKVARDLLIEEGLLDADRR